MTFLDKIRKGLDEKIKIEQDKILDESEVKYKLDEDGEKVLDEDGNPIVIEGENPFPPKDKKDDDKDDKDDKDDDKDKKDKKEKVDVKESLSKIFAKADIDEAVTADLEILFNAAVDEKVTEKVTVMEDEAVKAAEVVIESLEAKVDKYITYVAEEWMKENELQVENGIQLEISENLISGLKGIFEDSYVEVPESKVDLVAEAEETIDSLLTVVDESKEEIASLQKEINDAKAKTIVDEMSGEMTATQKEKLDELTNSIEYKDDSEYRKAVGVIVESYFNKKSEDLNEDEIVDKKDDIDPTDRMAQYKQVLK